MSDTSRKLQENRERREREALLETLPKSVVALLSDCSFSYSEAYFDSLACSPFPNFEDGKLVVKEEFPVYLYSEFDHIARVIALLGNSRLQLDSPCSLQIGKGPVFHPDAQLTLEHLIELARMLPTGGIDHIYAADSLRGLFISSYCGYLQEPPPPNSDEVVYEVVYFEKSSAGS